MSGSSAFWQPVTSQCSHFFKTTLPGLPSSVRSIRNVAKFRFQNGQFCLRHLPATTIWARYAGFAANTTILQPPIVETRLHFSIWMCEKIAISISVFAIITNRIFVNQWWWSASFIWRLLLLYRIKHFKNDNCQLYKTILNTIIAQTKSAENEIRWVVDELHLSPSHTQFVAQ